MKESLRASMAWLHTWAGLLVGWLLFAIFATGTAAYYRGELSLWMRPELQSASHPGAPAAAAAAHAVAFLQRTAPSSSTWMVQLPDARDGLLQVQWASGQGRPLAPAAARPGGRFDSAVLDAVSGTVAPVPRATRGGDFFYGFHFTLHYLPVRWGRWLTSAAALAMLVALVSGLVVHRRIFKDFFTFRPGRGQRSWLDAHNATAVLGLPFLLMISYSGLVTLMVLTMPAGLQAVYGDQRGAFIAHAFPQAVALPAATGQARPLVAIAPLLADAAAAWSGTPAASFTVLRPNDAAARVAVVASAAGQLSHARRLRLYDGTTGALIAQEGEADTLPSRLRNLLYGLHLGRFSDGALRALFFASGLLGCGMVATGLLLWSAKRQRHPGAGHRLVGSLHIAAVAGLPVAMAALLWANVLLPLELPARAAWEVHAFFTAWGAMLVLALVRPTAATWRLQWALAACGWIGAPLLRIATMPALRVDGVDAALAATGLVFALVARRVRSGYSRAPTRTTTTTTIRGDTGCKPPPPSPPSSSP